MLLPQAVIQKAMANPSGALVEQLGTSFAFFLIG